MTLLMKGAEVAAKLKEKILKDSSCLISSPTLGIIRVGNRPDNLSYEKGILKRFESLKLAAKIFELPENISQNDFDSAFGKINNDEKIHGLLLFRPLPKNLSDSFACEHINFLKDVDSMSALNAGKIFNGQGGYVPCTPGAVMKILAHYEINLEGKSVVIVGQSPTVGRPLAMLMLKENSTVTICHSKTKDLKAVCSGADVLVACMGKAEFITAEYVKPGAVVVDVGINFKDGRLCGDVDFQSVSPLAGAITPVPGGVGAVTTSILAENLLEAYKNFFNKQEAFF